MSTVGVMIGRFQVPTPHAGHRALYQFVSLRHSAVLVLVGYGHGLPSLRDPIPDTLRIESLKRIWPNATFLPLANHPSDIAWSASVDEKIAQFAGTRDVVLYGSRDSFLTHYSGRFPTYSVNMLAPSEGRLVRHSVTPVCSDDFLSGLIYAQKLRPALSYQAVDIVIDDRDHRRVLVGAKAHEGLMWRFPGGFVDPTDLTLESAAFREMREEVGDIGLNGTLRYVHSFQVDDWRYRPCADRIMTAVFYGAFMFGAPKAGDDIDALAWMPYDDLREKVARAHQPIVSRFLEEPHVQQSAAAH